MIHLLQIQWFLGKINKNVLLTFCVSYFNFLSKSAMQSLCNTLMKLKIWDTDLKYAEVKDTDRLSNHLVVSSHTHTRWYTLKAYREIYTISVSMSYIQSICTIVHCTYVPIKSITWTNSAGRDANHEPVINYFPSNPGSRVLNITGSFETAVQMCGPSDFVGGLCWHETQPVTPMGLMV